MSISKREVLTTYLDKFTAGNIDAVSQYIAEEFSFKGPILQTEGKQAFLEGLNPDLFNIMRGYTMLRQFEEGNEVCSIYEMHFETPVGKGSVLFAEWNHVADGQLTTSRVVFDTGAFMKLMPSEV
jgi:SnoaL-like domain